MRSRVKIYFWFIDRSGGHLYEVYKGFSATQDEAQGHIDDFLRGGAVDWDSAFGYHIEPLVLGPTKAYLHLNRANVLAILNNMFGALQAGQLNPFSLMGPDLQRSLN